ncbi:MAG: aldehyde dehydrogenase family protein, partial [Hymenobacter sp.]
MTTPSLFASLTSAPNHFQTQFDALRAQAPRLRHEAVAARRQRLRRLADWLTAHRTDIQQALYQDFRKPPAETDVTEIWASLVELKHTNRHLGRWLAPRRVGTPLALMGTKGWVQVEPKGVVLI